GLTVRGFLVLIPVVQFAVFLSFRLYSPSRLSPAEEFRRVLAAVTMSISGMVVLAFLFTARGSKLCLALGWSVRLRLAVGLRAAGGDQTDHRHLGLARRPRPGDAGVRGHRAGDQAELRGSGLLPAGADRAGGASLPDAEVQDDGRRRGGSGRSAEAPERGPG